MSGPGGKEVGRLAVKVVPDTDGFTAKVKAVAEKAEKEEIEIPLDLDTEAAEAKLKHLTRKREIKIEINVDTDAAEAKIQRVLHERNASIEVEADTQAAQARIDRAARDRIANIRVNLTGDRLNEGFDNEAFDRVRRRLIGIQRDYNRAASEAQAQRFRDMARQARQNIERQARDQRRVDRERDADRRRVNQEWTRFERAEAQRNQRIYTETARRLSRMLREMGSDFPDRLDVEVYVDPKRRMEAFRAELIRLQRERIRIEADLRGENGIQARIAALTRDRRIRIHASLDRNNFTSMTGIIGNAFKGMAGVALGAMSGMFRGLSVISSGLGNVGNVGQKVFGNLADQTSAAAGKMGTVAQVAVQVSAAIVSLGAVLAVIYAIVTALGALIVAAIGAVAALASVVIGAAALLALPAIFAGIGAAIIGLSDDNSKLKKEFGELKNTIVETFSKVGTPMIDFFSDSLEGMNKSLQKGTPLYRQLRTGFEESTKALTPLRSGLKHFAFQSLAGVNDALLKLNNTGTFHNFAAGLGGIGSVIGNFASRLADYGPEISTGFNSLVNGLDGVGQSVANWIGSFSGGAPAVIDSFAGATRRLLDQFAANQQTYSNAARNLGDSLSQAVPGFERLTAAMANMSPAIFDSLAAGINRLGDAVADEGTQQGLVALTTALINLTSMGLAGLTKATGAIGQHFQGLGDMFHNLTGKIRYERAISAKEFRGIIESESSTREKVNAGLNQLRKSLSMSSGDIGKQLTSYASGAVSAMNRVEGKAGEHVQSLAGKLNTLAQDWQKAGGKVNESWYEAWQRTSQEIDRSGDATLIKAKNQMNDLVSASQEFRQRLKENLVAALKAEGVNVDDSIISKIDQQLGIMADSAGKKSQEAIANIQRNFALLPGIIQTAMNEAKTPEQLQQKLMAVQNVMNSMTPQIAAAFAKLPTSMQETLSKSTAAFTAWTGMETFRQKVVTNVNQAILSFNRLGPAIGQISGPITGLSMQFSTAANGMHIFNNRVNWTNWILGQISASAGRTGSSMSRVGSGASSAASAMHRLNSSANSVNSSFNRAGSSAQQASSRIMYLRGVASNAGAGMSAFATTLGTSMARANMAVQTGVNRIMTTLRRLPAQSRSAGNLSAFVSSIQSSMSRAQGVVSSAVSSMLAQLQRLNTTVTATVNINRNETTRRKTIVEKPTTGRDLPGFFPGVDIPGFEAFEAQPRFDARALQTSSSMGAWGRTTARVINESRSSDGGGVVRNYEFNIEAAPNIPTEKQIIKQQRKAEALYG